LGRRILPLLSFTQYRDINEVMNHSSDDLIDVASLEAHSTSPTGTVYNGHGSIWLHSKSTVASLQPSIIIHML